jgi:proline dehydrogenase
MPKFPSGHNLCPGLTGRPSASIKLLVDSIREGGLLLRETLSFLAGNATLRRTARANPIARRLASRFVAGETLAQVMTVVRQTNGAGMMATLDYLGENVTTREEAVTAATSYVRALDFIADQGVDANVSCKPTHLGLDLGEDVAESMIRRVVETAEARDSFVRVDMEGSRYTDVTLELTKRMHAQYGHVGAVIQSCLYRSADDVRDLCRTGIRIRLVKGAYLEPPTIAFPRKHDVDENYRRLTELMLDGGIYPAFATHDPILIEFVKDRAASMGRKADEFEFQMLYGIRRDLQRRIRDEGYRMRLYIPFGTQWYPYLMRRLAERPANLMFIVGNVAREARGSNT